MPHLVFRKMGRLVPQRLRIWAAILGLHPSDEPHGKYFSNSGWPTNHELNPLNCCGVRSSGSARWRSRQRATSLRDTCILCDMMGIM
jgi:hypothetical protein